MSPYQRGGLTLRWTALLSVSGLRSDIVLYPSNAFISVPPGQPCPAMPCPAMSQNRTPMQGGQTSLTLPVDLDLSQGEDLPAPHHECF